jgi:hypothetical protein
MPAAAAADAPAAPAAGAPAAAEPAAATAAEYYTNIWQKEPLGSALKLQHSLHRCACVCVSDVLMCCKLLVVSHDECTYGINA